MASTAQKRTWYADWECQPSKMQRVTFPGVGRVWNLLVADVTVPAWQLFAEIMEAHDYLFRESAGGTYKCRNIAGSNKKSLHSYGIALDLNPSKNRFGGTATDMPAAFTSDVLATGVFRWGRDFNDPMHWEIDVPPDQIVIPEPLPEEDNLLPINAQSSKSDIRLIQGRLGITDDGTYGLATKAAVAALAARSNTGDTVGLDGTHVNARMYNQLAREYLSVAPPSSGLSEAQVKAIVNGSQIVAPD